MFLHEQFFCFVRSPFVAVPLGRSRYLKSKIETEKKEKRLLQPVVVPAVIVRTEKGVKIPGMRIAECSLRCIGLIVSLLSGINVKVGASVRKAASG